MPEKIRPQMFQSTNASPWKTSRRNPPSGGDGAGDMASPINQPLQTHNFLAASSEVIRLIFPTVPSWLPAGFPCVRHPVPRRIPFVPPDHLGGHHPGRPPPASS